MAVWLRIRLLGTDRLAVPVTRAVKCSSVKILIINAGSMIAAMKGAAAIWAVLYIDIKHALEQARPIHARW